MTSLTIVELFYRFGAALAIGLLVGLQREYAHVRQAEHADDVELFGGIRTMALTSLLGCTAAYLDRLLDTTFILAAVSVIFGALIVAVYYVAAKKGDGGLTSEVAAVVTFLVGAVCFMGPLELAAALGVVTTVLLALKVQTQTLVARLTREDIYATLKFCVLVAILLPILPRTGPEIEPFTVLVPYKIGLMVVLISGISFLGYILTKVVGSDKGTVITGLMGGLASSTAVTLSMARQSRSTDLFARSLALGILLSWTIMFVRMLIEVAAVNFNLLRLVSIPLLGGMFVCFLYCFYLYRRKEPPRRGDSTRFKNPFELGPAITFGLLYAAVILIANAAQMYYGQAGIYASSLLAGVADVDAITLSMAELSKDTERVSSIVAARAVVIAAIANTTVKGGLVAVLGTARLRKAVLPGMVATLGTALALMFTL